MYTHKHALHTCYTHTYTHTDPDVQLFLSVKGFTCRLTFWLYVPLLFRHTVVDGRCFMRLFFHSYLPLFFYFSVSFSYHPFTVLIWTIVFQCRPQTTCPRLVVSLFTTSHYSHQTNTNPSSIDCCTYGRYFHFVSVHTLYPYYHNRSVGHSALSVKSQNIILSVNYYSKCILLYVYKVY